APIDAPPADNEALVPQADLGEGRLSHRIAGLGAVAEGALLVLGPRRPPKARRPGSSPLEREAHQGLSQGGQVAGAGLSVPVYAQHVGDGEGGARVASESCAQL